MFKVRLPWCIALVFALVVSACSVSSGDDDETAPTDAPAVEQETAEPSEPSEPTESSMDASDDEEVQDTAAPADDMDDMDETDETDEMAEEREPLPGLTDDTIKIGIALLDQKGVFDLFGVNLGDPPPPELIPAIVATINDSGGIAGRSIEVVQRSFLPLGDDPAEQTCRELTEDEEVFAVIGFYVNDSPLCVAQVHERPYFGGFVLPPVGTSTPAPVIFVEPPEGRTAILATEHFLAEGVFDGRRVAVYYEEAAFTSTIDGAVVPALEAAGVDVVATAMLPDSGGDQVQSSNDLDLILQRFEADGADTLFAIAGATFLVPALDRSSWDPFDVVVGGQYQGPGFAAAWGLTDPTVFEGGRLAHGRVASEEAQRNDPQLQACVAGVNERTDLALTMDAVLNLNPEPGTFNATAILCQQFELVRIVLEAAGEYPSNEAIIAALDTIEPFSLGGQEGLTLSSDRWHVIDSITTATYDVSRAAFVTDAE